jgi:hypothetical protein
MAAKQSAKALSSPVSHEDMKIKKSTLSTLVLEFFSHPLQTVRN